MNLTPNQKLKTEAFKTEDRREIATFQTDKR